jgi:hypothetical protein
MAAFNWLGLAACTQALLTIAVLSLLGWRRYQAFHAGQVGEDAIVNDRSWPPGVIKASNNYKNQFELPVLFYAAIAIALATGITPASFVWMAWIFVVARIVHFIVHCWPNILAPRFVTFMISVFSVTGMWALISWRLLTGI